MHYGAGVLVGWFHQSKCKDIIYRFVGLPAVCFCIIIILFSHRCPRILYYKHY